MNYFLAMLFKVCYLVRNIIYVYNLSIYLYYWLLLINIDIKSIYILKVKHCLNEQFSIIYV